MKRAGLLSLVLCASCVAEEGTTLQILRVPSFDDQCKPSSEDNLYAYRGWFDPRGTGDSAPYGYELVAWVQNRIRTAENDPVKLPPAGPNRRVDGNDATMMGFDVCWLRADAEGDEEASRFEAFTDGVPDPLLCESLPDNQKSFMAASGVIRSGGGESAFGMQVLTREDLKVLYGTDFEPTALPDAGLGRDQYGNWTYNDGAGAAEPPRDTAWGNYPQELLATVIFQFRAIGKLQGGTSVESNWFVFPIDVCVGCYGNPCGKLGFEPCAGTGGTLCGTQPCPFSQCSDGSVCNPGDTCADSNPCPSASCPDASPCTPATWGFRGLASDFAGVCRPFQTGEFACIDVDECAAP